MRRPRSRLARSRRSLAFGAVWLLRAACFAITFLPIALVIVLSFGADAFTVIPPSE